MQINNALHNAQPVVTIYITLHYIKILSV